MTEAAALMAVPASAALIPEEARRWAQGLWIVLVTVWVVGMFMARRTARQQTWSSRIWQIGIVLLGVWLLFGSGTGIAWMDAPAFPVTTAVAMAGLATTLAGVAFAIWARVTLGANWSGVITVKEGHTLVRRGPYRIVRHPIYTGLLIGLAGTALTLGPVRGILALPICAFGFWLKTLTEERFMTEEFGEEYVRYRHEVRALVPFLF
jgi:protein-S-isoprenylcysteine O-methyltransferase Ste14